MSYRDRGALTRRSGGRPVEQPYRWPFNILDSLSSNLLKTPMGLRVGVGLLSMPPPTEYRSSGVMKRISRKHFGARQCNGKVSQIGAYYMPMRRGALFLTLMLAASGTPALADLLNVELTVSYLAPDTFPAHSHLVATATFYIDANGPQPTDSPGLIYLDVFDRNVTVIEDPSLLDHPCITDGSCGVDTSVRGTAGPFAVFAFPNTVDLPSVQPDLAPIIPIGTLASTDPCRHHRGDPCTQSGQLVAYDPGPVVVGTWEIKMSLVPEPRPVVLLATAILLLAWNCRVRRSRGEISKSR